MDNNEYLPIEYSVKIGSVKKNGNTMATASVTINGQFAILGVRIVEGKHGLFVATPSYKAANGKYADVCYPCTKEARAEFDKAVLTAYYEQSEAE